MIHVFVLLDGLEYKLHDAKYDVETELWLGEVVGKGVKIGINPRMVRIVYFFNSAAAYDTFKREGKLPETSRGQVGILSH
ncbi:MAG: hypothetical protein IMZ71_01390 [Chloroflexi bacterium]|nr:hypothetical protein [Chloroflexota bacterium]